MYIRKRSDDLDLHRFGIEFGVVADPRVFDDICHVGFCVLTRPFHLEVVVLVHI